MRSDKLNIEKSILDLNENFKKIKGQGWIKSKSNGRGAAGITLELLLGKERENFEIPDYEGIELKTSTQKGYKISLFNAVPDNSFFEIKRLFKKYSYFNKHNQKNFRIRTCTNKLYKIPTGINFKLNVDYKNKLIKLLIFDMNKSKIEEKVSWSFELLEEKLNRKLKYMALIDVQRKQVNNETYFKYKNINFYKLKNFETFIKLIEEGIIIIKFNINEKENKEGNILIYDHGTSFEIKLSDKIKLFEPINHLPKGQLYEVNKKSTWI